MTKITVVAGDWPSGTSVTYAKGFFGKPSSLLIGWKGARFFSQHIVSATHITQENSSSVLGKIGWGAVGGAELGSLGMLAGVVGGGNRLHHIIALELVDGRKALLKCDPEGFAAVMEVSHRPGPAVEEDVEWVKDTFEYRILNKTANLFGKGDRSPQPNQADDHSDFLPEIDADVVGPPRSLLRRLVWFIPLGAALCLAGFAILYSDNGKPEFQGSALAAASDGSGNLSASDLGSEMWVLADYTNRKTCPSLTCGTVGKLSRGEAVTVAERFKGWVRTTKYYDAFCIDGRSKYVEQGAAACVASNGIGDGMLAEWVAIDDLTSIRPNEPAEEATGVAALIKGSDDYRLFGEQFVVAAKQLLADGTCIEDDFTNVGGFSKSSKPGNVYFTYCGGMTLEKRIYLDASTGRFFR